MDQSHSITQDGVVPGGLVQAAGQFRQAASELLAVYGARKPERSDQVTPPQLIEAMEQVLTITTKVDKEEGESRSITREEVTQLGDYGLSLLLDLMTWAGQLQASHSRAALEQMALAITDWIVRHEGEVRTLEPVVNVLATRANGLRDPRALERLAEFMSGVATHTADFVKQDLEKMNPGRPWRLLNLNRAIVATRSHNPTLMECVFDELIRDFPQDAPDFFAQGMRQMDALDYPPDVRAVMSRYYARYHGPQNLLH